MTELTELTLKRWKKGYDLFIKGDHENALNLFELIEYSCPDKTCIPVEVALNKILAIVALEKHDQLLEIGSRLLRSNYGPFFLFSLGLILEKVSPKLSLDYFKKCVMVCYL